MQFKYPEILYSLLLLLVPIFIHLFQLRKFEKIVFTNVAFLKKVELQTRKSAKLKKFLILFSRLGIFAAVILAFAQPYISSNKQTLKPNIALYLDNSLSMQAKNGTNELFKDAVQNIISNYNSTSNLTLITNDNVFSDLTKKELKNTLLSLTYSPISKDVNTVLLQVNKTMKKKNGVKNHIVFISDFQTKNSNSKFSISDDVTYSFVQLKPQEEKNISIDSVYITKQNGLDISLEVALKSYNLNSDNTSVSLFKDNILIGKSTVELESNKTKTVRFKIPFNDSFNGKIVIEDNLISFDNELFFSLNKQEKINVLIVGDDNEYLTKIYTKAEFDLQSNKLNQVDYNLISSQNLIVLNELKIIPLSLQKSLIKFINNGGSLVIVPFNKSKITNYNTFFSELKIGAITSKIETEHLVNTINFSHPILDDVFEKRIKNFQYPNVKSYYKTNFKNEQAILKFENQSSFISEIKHKSGKIYWLASSINNSNSNFKSSPLIVPIFYNFAKQSFNLTALYYTIGQKNNIDIKTEIINDEVLHIEQLNNDNQNNKFIPLQNVKQQKVILQLEDNPLKAGFYVVKKDTDKLKNIAFNYNRNESVPKYTNVKTLIKNYKNTSYSTKIKETFNTIDNTYKVKSFWKWFLIIALLFLVIETLLIKFLKN